MYRSASLSLSLLSEALTTLPVSTEKPTTACLSRILWRRRLSVLIFIILIALSVTGCAGFGTDGAVEPDHESDRQQGLKNLAAIAELQASLSTPRPPPMAVPPDSHRREEPAPSESQIHHLPAPSWFSPFAPSQRESLQSQRLFPAMPPTTPSQSYTPSPYPLNPSLVPPYTVFAPAGSGYPGSLRCVPDYLGGSRCSIGP